MREHVDRGRLEEGTTLAQPIPRVAAVVKFGAGAGEDPFAKVKDSITDLINKSQTKAPSEVRHKPNLPKHQGDCAERKKPIILRLSDEIVETPSPHHPSHAGQRSSRQFSQDEQAMVEYVVMHARRPKEPTTSWIMSVELVWRSLVNHATTVSAGI